MSPSRRGDARLLLNQLVQSSSAVVHGPFAHALVEACATSRLWEVVAMVHRRLGEPAKGLRCALRSDPHRIAVCDYITDALRDVRVTDRSKSDLRSAVLDELAALHAADKHGAARMLLHAFPGEHERVMARLDDLPEMQFLYLRGVLHQARCARVAPEMRPRCSQDASRSGGPFSPTWRRADALRAAPARRACERADTRALRRPAVPVRARCGVRVPSGAGCAEMRRWPRRRPPRFAR